MLSFGEKRGGGNAGGADNETRTSSAAGMIPQTPQRDSISQSESAKRRGRPRGWTDIRIHGMLGYLKQHYPQFQTGHYLDFYHGLAAHLGDDLDHGEVREKLEKMVKHYESDKRRGTYDWKWYGKLNEIFRGPPIPAGAGEGEEAESQEEGEEAEEFEWMSKKLKQAGGRGDRGGRLGGCADGV